MEDESQKESWAENGGYKDIHESGKDASGSEAIVNEPRVATDGVSSVVKTR